MKKKITVVVKEPDRGLYEAEVENTLEALQKLVCGYIGRVRFLSDLSILVNEEGLIKNLPRNPVLGVEFLGNVVFIGIKAKGQKLCSVRGGIEKIKALTGLK